MFGAVELNILVIVVVCWQIEILNQLFLQYAKLLLAQSLLQI